MNTVNFPNVAATGAMLAGAAPQNPISNAQNAHITRQLGMALNAQGPFQGWRAEVLNQERAGKVWQMITSLRLIQPRIDLQNALHVALQFEEKVFREANTKDDYEKECANKLHAIKETRMRQQAVYTQGGLLQQHGGVAGGMPGAVRPNQVPPQFTPQVTRPMQSSPISGQMALHMGLNDPNMIQQQQQQQLQQRQQQAALAQNQMGQQQRLMSGMAGADELSMLSQQEFDQVCQMTASVMTRLGPEEVEKRRQTATRNMSPETKQMITQKYGDPFTWMMRMQILRNLKGRRPAQMARPQGLDPNSSMMGGDAMLNAAQRQMTQNTMGLQRNSALAMNNQQSLDPSSFMGNVENIQGQQADGLRSQEAGQLVVPASNAPMTSQPSFATSNGLFQSGALPQSAQNLNRPANPQQLLAQQQLQNAQNAQQGGLQQTSQFQAQNQVQNPAQAQAQARAQAAAAAAAAAHNPKLAMSAQAGGQNAAQLNQSMPHQSPGMSMLNRPVGPNMSPAQAAGQVRPPSRQPGMNGQQPGNQQQTMRPQLPPNIPPALQERLAQMTPEQLNAFLMAQQRHALANNQAARMKMNGQSMPMQPNMSQQSQGGPFNDPNMRTTMALQQSLNGIAGGPQNNPMLQGQQQLSLQQQQLLRQQQQLMRSQSQNVEMTPEQIREMDNVPFPPGIINSNANMNPPVPKTVKTWGQLKTWVVQNPQVLGNVDLSKLLDLQRLHFVHAMPQQREAGRNNELSAQPNWAANPQLFMNGQNAPAGRPIPPMPSGPPVTAAEILAARQRIGSQSQNLSDEQVKNLIIKHRQRLYMQHLQARGMAAQQLNQSQSAQQPQMPTPSSTKPMVPPLPPTTQPPQQTQPPSQTANAKTQQTPTGGRNAKSGAASSKAASKKRPHGDDLVEVQNPKAQQALPQPTTSAPPTRSQLPFTREQLAALSPQKRAQLEAQLKQRPSRPQLTRATAEENWNNNLPDHVKGWSNEISKAVNANAGSLNISAEDKAIMAQQLRENTDMLSRMDSLVHWLAKMPNQEKSVKALLSMRMQLMKQFKPSDWSVNEEFTIAPDYLKKSIMMIKNMFSGMISKVQSQQQIQKQRGPPPQANEQSHVPPLNASNLQQLEEEAKRARRASHNVPAAPTSAQPPFPIGAPSPQGVPQAYGPGGFSPDKLKIPASKRRKQSHASVTTSQGGAGTKAGSKVDSSKAGAIFKCAVVECEHNTKGFSSQAALDKHVEDEHKVKEEITDPLKYALESFDSALGVPTQDKIILEGEQNSIHGDAALVKQEVKGEGVTPITAGATPMSRLVSQTDAKFPSPTSNNLATPRSQAAKTTKAAAAKKSKASAKRDAAKVTDQPTVSGDLVGKDSWADSSVSLDIIQDTFDIPISENYPGLGGDYFDEFLNVDMFTISQTEDTPDSIDSNGLVTQTPKDGEMVKEEPAIQINDEDDVSYPTDWFSHPGPMFGGNDDPWLDWDVLGKELEAAPLDRGLSFTVS